MRFMYHALRVFLIIWGLALLYVATALWGHGQRVIACILAPIAFCMIVWLIRRQPENRR